VYADGNDFGKRQREECITPELQTKFDVELKEHRRNFLKSLLEKEVFHRSDWLRKTVNAPDVYRMETLLWGGDEFLLIVPAWKGWTTLQLFFDYAKDWKLLGKDVTHAAGLVFCHHTAPISRMATLVRKLCESAKKVDKNRNLFGYQALESFDVLPNDFHEYRKQLAPNCKVDSLSIDGTKMKAIADRMSVLKDTDFPRRKLFALARGAQGEDEKNDFLTGLPQEGRDALNELAKLLSTEALWYHVAELWDYVGKGEATPWL
jgi:hypothetical protein